MARKMYLEDSMNCHGRYLENLKSHGGKNAKLRNLHLTQWMLLFPTWLGFQLDLKASCIKNMTHNFMNYGIRWATLLRWYIPTDLPNGALQGLRAPYGNLWPSFSSGGKILRTIELEDLILMTVRIH